MLCIFCDCACKIWNDKRIHYKCKYNYVFCTKTKINTFKTKNFEFALHFDNMGNIDYGDVYSLVDNSRSLLKVDLSGLTIDSLLDIEKFDKQLYDLIIYV